MAIGRRSWFNAPPAFIILAERAAATIEHWARFLYPTLLVLGFFAIMAHGLAGR